MWLKIRNCRLFYFGIVCLVFVAMLVADYFMPKNPTRRSKVISQLNNTLIAITEDTYSRNIFDIKLSFNKDNNLFARDIVSNNSKTFHKIFIMWLKNRLLKTPLKLVFTLMPIDSCTNHGQNLSILIAVTSKSSHIESRSAIRETWGNLAKKMGAKVYFFLGQPPNTRYHAKIINENTKFHDIIQTAFLDTYANLTLKTIAVLKWVSEVCPSVKYVLKVDDDMFINVENIINITKNQNISMTILGELAHRWHPVRSIKNKWYTSYEEYPFDVYPDFVFGPSYLLSGDVIQTLYKSSIRMNVFHLEDVYVTGFVAEKENIPRINHPAMFNTVKNLQPCQFNKLISSHGHTAHDIRRHWKWLTRKNFQCS